MAVIEVDKKEDLVKDREEIKKTNTCLLCMGYG